MTMKMLLRKKRRHVRKIRGRYRRWRYPDGPPYGRLSMVPVIMALHRCSFDRALEIDRALAAAARVSFYSGF